VLAGNVNVRTRNGALEMRPMPFQSIGVMDAVHVLLAALEEFL
jgi:hypothetical protein